MPADLAQALEPDEHHFGQFSAAHTDQAEILAVAAARTVWSHGRTPLDGTHKVGHQCARLADIIRSSTLYATIHEDTVA